MSSNPNVRRFRTVPISVEKENGSQTREGIQGGNNSCYVDSTLMSLFYYPIPKLEHLVRNLDTENLGSSQVGLKFYHGLSELITILRQAKYCSATKIDTLRNYLSKMNVKLVIGEMMDVTDLITTMFGKNGLNLPHFLKYQTGTFNYYHQLQLKPDLTTRDEPFGDLAILFQDSLKEQQLEIVDFTGGPLLIKMPRSNGKLLRYKGIVPPMALEIGGTQLGLRAVICLHHCHYTAFILSPSGWVFYDSMAEFMTPRISETGSIASFLEDVELKDLNSASFVKTWDKNVRHLITNIHLCVYAQEKAKIMSGNNTQKAVISKEIIPPPSKPKPFKINTPQENVAIEQNHKIKNIEKRTSLPKSVQNKTNNETDGSVKATAKLSEQSKVFENLETPTEIDSDIKIIVALQYVLWAHKTTFDTFLATARKPALIKHVQDVFIRGFRPPQFSGSFTLSQEKQTQVKKSFGIASDRISGNYIIAQDLAGVLNCYNFEDGMIPLDPFRPNKELYYTLSSSVRAQQPGNPTGTTAALTQSTTQNTKFKGLPSPALIIIKNTKLAEKIFPDYYLGLGKSADNLSGTFLKLASVICTSGRGANQAFIAYNVTKNAGNETAFMVFDASNGKESEVPDLYKSLYPGENPTHSTPFMMTALKNKHVKKMYDDGVLWIYVKEPK